MVRRLLEVIYIFFLFAALSLGIWWSLSGAKENYFYDSRGELKTETVGEWDVTDGGEITQESSNSLEELK